VLGNDGLTMTGLPHLAERDQGEDSLRRVAAIDTGGETLCYEDIIVECVSRNRNQNGCCESFHDRCEDDRRDPAATTGQRIRSAKKSSSKTLLTALFIHFRTRFDQNIVVVFQDPVPWSLNNITR
jgi:hypothetical protein